MTAAAVAQRLGLSEAAVAAFSGTGAEFAQFFGKSVKEGEEAVADLTPPATVPAAPTAVVATVTALTVVSLAFTPGADGGSPITGYTAVASPSVILTPEAPTDVTSPVSFSANFNPGIAYTFTLRAVNAIGNGALSAASAPVTPNP